MKLFLASSLDETIDLLPKKVGSIKDKKIIFIENAADNYQGEKWWITLDKKAFEELGGIIVPVDLRTITKESFEKILSESNIIHFCGGSVLYLMSLIEKMGLGSLIVEAVKKNLIYTGTSAGSMIVSNDLSIMKFDPEEKAYATLSKTHEGLALIHFLIIPHADNAEFIEANKIVVEHLLESKQALIFLNDDQVVWVEDGKFEIIT